MIRLSLFILLLLTSTAVLVDVQINVEGNIYVPPCTINNGQNIVVDFRNTNSEYVDNSRGETTKIISISCLYKNGSLWIKITGNAIGGGQNSVLATGVTHFGIALHQGKGMSTPLTLGNGSGDGHRMAAGSDTTCSAFTFTSTPSHNGSGILSGGDFQATASMSVIYN